MSATLLLFLVAGLGLIGWFVARAKAQALYSGRGSMHSRPGHHGWHLALWVALPALLGIAAWGSISPNLVHSAILADPAVASLPMMDMERNAVLSEAYAIAQNPDAPVFNPEAEKLVPAIRAANQQFGAMGAALTLILAFAGGAFGYTRIRADFPARTYVERLVLGLLLIASLLAIFTTVGIIASLLYETGIFFSKVNAFEFLTGLHWSPANGRSLSVRSSR